MFIRFLAYFSCFILFAQVAHCEDIPRYNRDLFGGWSDADQDCQNTRHELLQAASTGAISFSNNTCRVTKGRWLDPYTNKIFFESRQVDIDHLVPLKYAWERGAHSWATLKLTQFSNDPANLFVVQKSVNRRKSAYGPSEWLPPSLKFRCQYILRFQRIVRKYSLEQSAAELHLIRTAQQQNCG